MLNFQQSITVFCTFLGALFFYHGTRSLVLYQAPQAQPVPSGPTIVVVAPATPSDPITILPVPGSDILALPPFEEITIIPTKPSPPPIPVFVYGKYCAINPSRPYLFYPTSPANSLPNAYSPVENPADSTSSAKASGVAQEVLHDAPADEPHCIVIPPASFRDQVRAWQDYAWGWYQYLSYWHSGIKSHPGILVIEFFLAILTSAFMYNWIQSWRAQNKANILTEDEQADKEEIEQLQWKVESLEKHNRKVERQYLEERQIKWEFKRDNQALKAELEESKENCETTINELNTEIEFRDRNRTELEDDLEAAQREINDLVEKHQKEMQKLKDEVSGHVDAKHDAKALYADSKQKFDAEKVKYEADYSEQLSEERGKLLTEFSKRLQQLMARRDAEAMARINQHDSDMTALVAQHKTEMDDLQKQLERCNGLLAQTKSTYATQVSRTKDLEHTVAETKHQLQLQKTKFDNDYTNRVKKLEEQVKEEKRKSSEFLDQVFTSKYSIFALLNRNNSDEKIPELKSSGEVFDALFQLRKAVAACVKSSEDASAQSKLYEDMLARMMSFNIYQQALCAIYDELNNLTTEPGTQYYVPTKGKVYTQEVLDTLEDNDVKAFPGEIRDLVDMNRDFTKLVATLEAKIKSTSSETALQTLSIETSNDAMESKDQELQVKAHIIKDLEEQVVDLTEENEVLKKALDSKDQGEVHDLGDSLSEEGIPVRKPPYRDSVPAVQTAQDPDATKRLEIRVQIAESDVAAMQNQLDAANMQRRISLEDAKVARGEAEEAEEKAEIFERDYNEAYDVLEYAEDRLGIQLKKKDQVRRAGRIIAAAKQRNASLSDFNSLSDSESSDGSSIPSTEQANGNARETASNSSARPPGESIVRNLPEPGSPKGPTSASSIVNGTSSKPIPGAQTSVVALIPSTKDASDVRNSPVKSTTGPSIPVNISEENTDEASVFTDDGEDDPSVLNDNSELSNAPQNETDNPTNVSSVWPYTVDELVNKHQGNPESIDPLESEADPAETITSPTSAQQNNGQGGSSWSNPLHSIKGSARSWSRPTNRSGTSLPPRSAGPPPKPSEPVTPQLDVSKSAKLKKRRNKPLAICDHCREQGLRTCDRKPQCDNCLLLGEECTRNETGKPMGWKNTQVKLSARSAGYRSSTDESNKNKSNENVDKSDVDRTRDWPEVDDQYRSS